MRTQAEQIDALRADQAFWRALAAEVGPARYAEPGPMGDWSFADMAGHLAGWRERTINRVRAFGRCEPQPAAPWPEALEAVPAHIQTARVPWADEPLVEVDFTSHLHDEHVAPVRAWLDGAQASA